MKKQPVNIIRIPIKILKRSLFKITSNKSRSSKDTLNSGFTELQDVNDLLFDSAKDFELRFSKVLVNLEQLEDTSSKLTTESAALLSLSSTEDNPILDINEQLKPYIEFITGTGCRISSITEDLGTDQKKISKTLSVEKRLQQTFSQLTYLRTLFAVEASPLEQHVKDMFTSLVDEIYRLQKDVSEIFRKNFHQLRDHEKTINSLTQDLDKQINLQKSILETKQKESQEALDSMKRNLQDTIRSNDQLNHSVQDIEDSIGQVIISLQSQDIVNQKLEHIFELSKEMQERFSSIGRRSNRSEKCRELRFVEKVASILINQIRFIINEIEETENRIRTSLASISQYIETIDNASILPTASSTKEINESHESLRSAIRDTAVIIKQTEKTAKSSFKKIEPIRSMASNVTETILNLSAQLHLIGLNAEVHAARVEGVTGLGIISSKTSSISTDTRILCKEVSTNLDDLVLSLNNNVTQFETLYKDSENHSNSLSAISPKLESDLQEYHSNTISSTHTIGSNIERLTHLIKTTTENLDISSRMTSNLGRLETCLNSLSSSAKRQAENLNIEVDISDLMESLMSHYTMEAEKSIHLSSLGLESNIEPLNKQRENHFDTEKHLAKTSKNRVSVDSFERFDADFFESEEQTEEATNDANRIESLETKKDFGDNVDFF